MSEDKTQRIEGRTQNSENRAQSANGEGRTQDSRPGESPVETELRTQIDAIGVRFRACGKIALFAVNGVDVTPGMQVVAESEMGVSIGLVVKAKHTIDNPEQQVKKLLRIATEEDLEADKNNRSLEAEAKSFCIEKAKSHNLPMKVIATEATLDRKRLIFYFTADERIDFRELVRDLAGKFKTRIEMRQIGVRDEVKFVGGIGACGRQTCCTLFLTSFEPVSIRMAKKQELILNPSKLSGICGRLMCCLGYEYKQPVDAKEKTSQEIVLDEPQEGHALIAEEEEAGHEEDTSKPSADSPPPNIPTSKPIDSRLTTPDPGITQSAHKPSAVHPASEARAEQQRGERGKPFSRRKRFWKKKKK